MSDKLHGWIGSPATATGLRSIGGALSISLCVHAALVGIFWHYVVTLPPVLREVRVELASSAQPPAAAPALVAPAQAASAHVEHKRPARSERIAHARASVAPAAAAVAAASAPAVTKSSAAPETALAEQAKPQAGAPLPLDLRVLDWLARYRTYPLAARRARIEGVVQLRVTLLPDGRLVDARVEHSSGHAMLDRAALELLTHAAPLPPEFGGTRTGRIELQLPIVYRMRT